MLRVRSVCVFSKLFENLKKNKLAQSTIYNANFEEKKKALFCLNSEKLQHQMLRILEDENLDLKKQKNKLIDVATEEECDWDISNIRIKDYHMSCDNNQKKIYHGMLVFSTNLPHLKLNHNIGIYYVEIVSGNEVNNGYIVTTMEREFDLKKATQDYIALNGCLLKKISKVMTMQIFYFFCFF